MTGQIFFEAAELSTGETSGVVNVPIVRTGDLSGRVVVQFATTNQDAIAGQDYVSRSGTVVMDPGVSRVNVPITIINDAASEITKKFVVSIINVDSGVLSAPRTAQVSILDDENPVVDPPNPPLVSAFDVKLVDVFEGYFQPTSIEFSPLNPNVMYVAEKDGVISVQDTVTGQVSTLLDIKSKVNSAQDRGLLDIALHPDLANNPYLYMFYVVDPADDAGKTGNAGPDGGGNRYSHVVRYTLDVASGYKSVVAGSDVIILGSAGNTLADISGAGAIDSTSDISARDSELAAGGGYKQDYLKVDARSHAGGSLEFGPDGKLYISTGDGTSFNLVDPRSLSVQDTNSLAGKILRVDPLTGDGLADNPFYSGGSLDVNSAKVYQLGLRNPFSISFDKVGQLFITDTGWNNFEEVNTGGPGANFGWPYYEGGDNGVLLQTFGYRDLPSAPAFYQQVANGQIKITAAFRGFSHTSSDPGFQVQGIVGADDVIRSPVYPTELQNDYVFADYSQGEIYSVDVNDRQSVKFLAQLPGLGPVHYKQGPDGYLYYVSIETGKIGRIEITKPGVPAPVLSGSLQAEYFIDPATRLSEIDFNANPAFAQNVTSIKNPATTGAFYPGGPTDNFGVKYTGAFNVGITGYYTFYLKSDDGSKLFLDGKEVINNDGLHGSTEKTVNLLLTSGTHVIKVNYFEATGGAELDLDWSGPLFSRQDMNFDGINATTVINDRANQTQYLNGTPTGKETFYIDGKSSDYIWNPLSDGTGYLVYGVTGFDLLYNGFDFIRFNDQTVDLTGGSGLTVTNTVGQIQFVRGSPGRDVFVIDGLSKDYNWGPTLDGQDHIVYRGSDFDILYDWEIIKFNDVEIDLTSAAGRTVDNVVGQTQYLQGTPGRDVFVINGLSANYVVGPTLDGQDHIVYNATEFDLLYSWEAIRFNDRTVELV